jgi:hypothetical protein
MQSIPFGKFFDTQADHELISSLKLMNSYELDPYTRDMVYLFTNNATSDNYIVVDTDHGPDWKQVEDWTRKILQDRFAKLEEIHPKNPNLYADSYYLFRVIH